MMGKKSLRSTVFLWMVTGRDFEECISRVYKDKVLILKIKLPQIFNCPPNLLQTQLNICK